MSLEDRDLVVKEPFYKLIRSKEGPFVSVELDDAAEAGSSFLHGLPFNIGVALTATALGWGLSRRFIGGRHIVRVGISKGAGLVTSSHGYPKRDNAILVAQ
jgi:hypothetical protein